MNITKRKMFVPGCFLAVMMLFLLSGCSGEQAAMKRAQNSKTNEEVIERNRAYLSEYPNGDYAVEARRQIELAEIRLAGKGHGFPDAAEFDDKKGRPYKIFIIDVSERRPGEILITKHAWNEFVPSEWAAGTITDASLFCIINEGDLLDAGSQRYDNGMVLHGYIVITNVEVREARTGSLLFSGQLEGSHPLFPYSVSSTTYPTIKGSPASYRAFEDWLLKTVP